MPYVACSNCSLRTFSVAVHAHRDCCPSCGAVLLPTDMSAGEKRRALLSEAVVGVRRATGSVKSGSGTSAQVAAVTRTLRRRSDGLRTIGRPGEPAAGASPLLDA